MPHYYTDDKNAQIVIALLKAHGIRKIIASPGTTNIPITGSIQNDPFFEIYSSADERSAAYMACGLSCESGEPVVLSCTGSTASRNYLPGLTEACYRKLPVIAITSTSSTIKVGHLLPQIVDRSVSPNDIASLRVTLPIVKDAKDFWDCQIKVNKALIEVGRNGGGPVHINLPTEDTGTFNTKELPAVRCIHWRNYFADIPPISPQTKVVVFIGSHKPFKPAETEAIEHFVRTHNAVVFCDHTSSYKGYGRILSSLACSQSLSVRPNFALLKPDLIIHLGEISGDYPTTGFLEASGAKVWRVSEDGEVRDLLLRLEYVFEMRELDFFAKSSSHLDAAIDNSYLRTWSAYSKSVSSEIPELPFSNIWIAHELSSKWPVNAVLHFGILNSLRSWNFFNVNDLIQTASNVGGFGIDGCVSALIGASLARKDMLYFCIVGDLAFFYDLNSIGNRHISNNVRILLINNGGGGEFEMYSHFGSQFDAQTGDYIAAAGHYGNKSRTLVRHFVTDLGFKYLTATNKEEFQRCMHDFITPEPSDKPIVLECFTDFESESNALLKMRKVDTSVTFKSLAKDAAKSVLSRGVQASIRKLLGG